MQPQDFRCHHRLSVRWAEVDAQKIVFNAHYLMYADVAITEYWKQMAMPYAQSWASLGGELFVKKASVTYHASAQMGDVLDVGIRCVKQGNTSLQFEAGIFRGQQLLNTVELVYVFANEEREPQPVPQQLRDMLTAYEAGRTWSRCAQVTGTIWGVWPSACAWKSSSKSRACRARSRLTSLIPSAAMWWP